MAEYSFESYIPRAIELVHAHPGARLTHGELQAQLTEIPQPEGYDNQRVLDEARIIAAALLRGQSPTDMQIRLHPANSLRIANEPLTGWFLANVGGSTYWTIQDGEQKEAPQAIMLGVDSDLYVYEPDGPAENAIPVMRKRYIPETSSPDNDLAISFGLAMLVARHELDLEPVAG